MPGARARALRRRTRRSSRPTAAPSGRPLDRAVARRGGRGVDDRRRRARADADVLVAVLGGPHGGAADTGAGADQQRRGDDRGGEGAPARRLGGGVRGAVVRDGGERVGRHALLLRVVTAPRRRPLDRRGPETARHCGRGRGVALGVRRRLGQWSRLARSSSVTQAERCLGVSRYVERAARRTPTWKRVQTTPPHHADDVAGPRRGRRRTTRALKPRSRSSLADLAVDEAHRLLAVAAHELRAAVVRLGATSMTAPPAPGSPNASWNPVGRLATERSRSRNSWSPAYACSSAESREQADHPRAHHVDLGVEVAALGDRARRRPREPVVADQPVDGVEPPLVRISRRRGRDVRTTRCTVPVSAGAARRWSSRAVSSAVVR